MNIIKNTKKNSEKKHVKCTKIFLKTEKWPKKDIKCFLKKKIQRNCQCHGEGNKNLSEEQKQRPVEYMRNYLKK